MEMQRKLGLAVVLGTALLAAACSSNNDDAPSPTAGVPASASNDSAGLVGYLSQLVQSTGAGDDLVEAADIGNFNPPTSAATETEDPKEIAI